MPEGEIAQSNQSETNNKEKRRSRAWLWWVLGGVIIAIGLLFASYFLKDTAERAKFLVDGVLSSLVLAVIITQALIYNQQRRIMAQQIEHARISERAYIGIKQVFTENQQVGAVPVVRVTLSNGGRTPAYQLKVPGTLSITRTGEYPHERPDVSEKEGSMFLPADAETIVNYPFTIQLTPQWFQVIESGQYDVFLHIEAHFIDVWGDKQIMPFKLAYRAKDRRWGNYKDHDETEPIIEIS